MAERLKLSDRRKAIKSLYTDDKGTRTYVRQSTSRGSRNVFTEENLDRIIDSLGSTNFNYERLAELTNYAYAVNSNYANVIDYFANMFLWRYYYIPVLKKDKANPSKYEEIYNLMEEVIDGLHAEVLLPTILTTLFKDGAAYIFTDKNKPSNTVTTYLLNPKYCAPVMMSQYGTGIFQFDAEYFDDLGLTDEDLETVLNLYPKELVKGYKEYKNGGPQYFILDGRYSTYIRLNEHNFPNKLQTLRSILDYKKYRANEVERNSSKLDKIISHKIPSYEDQLLFSLQEVSDLHSSMSRQLSSNSRARLITTFGDLKIEDLGGEDKVQNEILEKAHKAIYNSAGLNTNLFNGKDENSLTVSLKKDAAIVWKYIQQIMNFYNLSINNLYNFKGYQVELNMLPITHYNSSELIKQYQSNAEYGVGKLEFIVAAGTKQKHIKSKAQLEDHLELDNILKPLQSSHTRSGNEDESGEEEKDNDSDNKEPSSEEENPDENEDENEQ